jgi:wyosine [tRNA(Phe)-imidazoG37] synthetase (radical SAM superfamily)
LRDARKEKIHEIKNTSDKKNLIFNMKIIYGPVSSWRLGESLGIDLICSEKKICSFDCIYCQLGKQSNKTINRKKFISLKELINELTDTLDYLSPDVITFSGMGEPTLANNLIHAIRLIRNITNIPIAILTNSSLMNNKKVLESLCLLDFVVAKLDAPNEKLFQEINRPVNKISLRDTIDGIKKFKKLFTGKFSIQTMFMNNNMDDVEEIANLVSEIEPNEVQINTPLRPCAIKPLTDKKIDEIEDTFKARNLNTISVYKSPKPKTSPLDKMDLIKRRRSVL